MKRYLLPPRAEPVLEECPIPDPAEGEVLVRIRACSLNYRDLLMKQGKSASSGELAIVPLSDGAGEIAALGRGVEDWSEGDRVALTFFRDWEDGPFAMRYHQAARGGSCDGVLSEFVAVPAHSVVPVPGHLSLEEASCLPCAALTAWHALFERSRPLAPGDTVLCLGTGGVSILALQLAVAAGATVFLTSSSDEKLERAALLGADHLINYRTHPDWETILHERTEKRGVDHVIEVGGPGTLEKSLASVAAGGSISLIGVLTGFDPSPAGLFPVISKAIDINGIYVGSRAMFLRMNGFLEERGIAPVIGRTFAFEEVGAAYDHLASGTHFGKIVISW